MTEASVIGSGVGSGVGEGEAKIECSEQVHPSLEKTETRMIAVMASKIENARNSTAIVRLRRCCFCFFVR